MASRELRSVYLPAVGGLNTSPDTVLLKPTDLVTAQNIEYGHLGSRFKRGGSTISHGPVTLGGSTSATVSGVADFWRFGTSLTPTQRLVFVAVTDSAGAICTGGLGGSVVVLKAPWSAGGRQTAITLAEGKAVFSDGVDTPQVYDQSTVATLSASMPIFTASRYHLRRLWYYGVAGGSTESSSVYYTAAGDIADATGSDTGSFIFDEDDGDAVQGVSAAWRERLFVFKGPHKGSVHYIGGTNPSDFTKGVMFQRAAPCVGHASVITTENDIYWMSRYGFHSLQATQKYGDTEVAYLSAPVQDQFKTINLDKVAFAQGFHNPARNIVGWAVSSGTDGSLYNQNTLVFVYHYLLGIWSIWTFDPAFRPASLAMVINPLVDPTAASGGIPGPFQYTLVQPSAFQVAAQEATYKNLVLCAGDYQGAIHVCDQDTKADISGDVGLPYPCTITTPPIHDLPGKDALTEAEFTGVVSFVRPLAATTCSLAVAIDGRETTYSVDLTNPSVAYVETALAGDRGRAIQLSWTQHTEGLDLHLLGYAVRYRPAETQAREVS